MVLTTNIDPPIRTTTTNVRQRTGTFSTQSSSLGENLEEQERLLTIKREHNERLHQEISKIVLWRQPIYTIT